MRYWQDIETGETFNTPRLTVTKEDILEFAAEFDPQPYHLDTDAASASIFGGLCASGWQVTALMTRLLSETMQENNIATLGAAGVRKLRWKIPVFAGDELSATLEVTGSGPSQNPGMGELECHVVLSNQHSNPVIWTNITLLVQLRENQENTDEAPHGHE